MKTSPHPFSLAQKPRRRDVVQVITADKRVLAEVHDISGDPERFARDCKLFELAPVALELLATLYDWYGLETEYTKQRAKDRIEQLRREVTGR